MIIALLLACIQSHPRVNCTTEKRNGARNSLRMRRTWNIDYVHIYSPWLGSPMRSKINTWCVRIFLSSLRNYFFTKSSSFFSYVYLKTRRFVSVPSSAPSPSWSSRVSWPARCLKRTPTYLAAPSRTAKPSTRSWNGGSACLSVTLPRLIRLLNPCLLPTTRLKKWRMLLISSGDNILIWVWVVGINTSLKIAYVQ